jgi:flagellar biosynthetic protein FlhB
MADDSGQERTETATGKKREDARQKGQVCQSREVTSAALLLFGIGFFYFFAPAIVRSLVDLNRGFFAHCAQFPLDPASLFALVADVTAHLARTVVPFLLLALAIAVFSNVAQFGFNWAPEALKFDLNRLNFVAGVGKLFKLTKLFDLAKSLVKIFVVGYVAYGAVRAHWDRFLPTMRLDPPEILAFMGRLTFTIALRVAYVMVALAVLDYAWQRWQYEKNLRMTKQEVKDEFKQREGDPLVKGRIRRIQMEIAQRRMIQAVPKADVVLTNPTHLAVAVRYEPRTMAAPIVVAKGKGFVAQKIREAAAAAGVPILERKPLAQALYKLVKIGQAIPADLYQSIAEVLAYVYKLTRKRI